MSACHWVSGLDTPLYWGLLVLEKPAWQSCLSPKTSGVPAVAPGAAFIWGAACNPFIEASAM